MANIPALPNPKSWPYNLKHKQGLTYDRGDVFVIDGTFHAIVGFDGRDDGYICWCAGAQLCFDTSQFVVIERCRAHVATLDTGARDRVPLLPALDHTGRVAGEGSHRTPPCSVNATPKEALLSSRRPEAFGPAPQAPAGRSDKPPKGRPLAGGLSQCSSERMLPGGEVSAREMPSFKIPTPCKSLTPPPSPEEDACEADPPTQPIDASENAPWDSSAGEPTCGRRPERGLELAQPAKQCMVCLIYKILRCCISRTFALMVAAVLPIPSWARPSERPPNGRIDPERSTLDVTSSCGLASAGCTDAEFQGDVAKGLQITIPIVRPLGWKELHPLLEGNTVTFDERGWKETMTVRAVRWHAFVDKQKAKMQKELQQMRDAQELQASTSSGGVQAAAEEPSADDAWGRQNSVASLVQRNTEDIAELEHLVEHMEDWKDLTRYSGKSISMASTRHGHEMRIHVLAFAEQDHGLGVDFMRLSYKKSIEIRQGQEQPRCKSLGHALSHLLAWEAPQEDGSPGPGLPGGSRERSAQLLQRPDVAKFAIALAFRKALARDGVHLQFCDSLVDSELC